MPFEHFTIEHGLPSNWVWGVWQDRRGFLWFGTSQGLARYDGQSFKVFKHDPADTTTISHNSAKPLHEDSFGYLWISAGNRGLARFDPRTEKFVLYRWLQCDSSRLRVQRIVDIHEDRHGVLWLAASGENGGIYRYHRATDSFTRYSHDPGNSRTLSSNEVHCIVEDDEGNFWIGFRGPGLNKFNPQTGQVVRFTQYQELVVGFWHGIKDR